MKVLEQLGWSILVLGGGLAWVLITIYMRQPEEWREAPARYWMKPLVALGMALGVGWLAAAALAAPESRSKCMAYAALPFVFGHQLWAEGLDVWARPISQLSISDMFVAVALPLTAVGVWMATLWFIGYLFVSGAVALRWLMPPSRAAKDRPTT